MKMSLIRLRLELYRHRKKSFLIFLIACVIWCVYSLIDPGLSSLKDLQCSHQDSEVMIKELCSLYNRGKVVGNMCPDMCNKGYIKFKKCLNYKGGKHVLLVDCIGSCDAGKTVPAVLKTNHIEDKDMNKYLKKIDRELFEIFTYIKVFDKDVHPIDYLIDYKHLLHKLGEKFYNEYGYMAGDNKDLLGTVWGEDHMQMREMNDDDPTYPINFVRTLWALLAQNEYKMIVLFRDWNIFPKIYGFCGPLYLSEHAPFDERLDRRFGSQDTISWRNRALTAVHILNLVHATETMQVPLQLCDVKTPHFGTNGEGEIRFTDSDSIFTNNTLNMILKTTPCQSDKDCAFFDCLGTCNAGVGLCAPYRINNNLQCVCSKILQDEKGNVYEGILSNPPKAVASKIEALLNECVNSVTEHRGNVVIRNPTQLFLSKFTNTLLDSLEYY